MKIRKREKPLEFNRQISSNKLSNSSMKSVSILNDDLEVFIAQDALKLPTYLVALLVLELLICRVNGPMIDVCVKFLWQ